MPASLSLVTGAPPRRAPVAVGAFALSFLSCLLIPAPIAIILGMVALVQLRRDATLMGRGFAIAAIVIASVMSLGVLTVAAVLPSFIRVDGRAPRSEARSNLKAIYTLTRAFEAEQDRLTADFLALGYAPLPTDRYALVTAAQPISVDNERTVLRSPQCSVSEEQVKQVLLRSFAGGVRPGVEGVCPADCWMTAIAVGNIDDDPFLDVWSVSTKARTAQDGTTIQPGEPYVEADDTRD